MSTRSVCCAILVAAFPASRILAQGAIAGVVRDSASRPLSGVDVVARPGGHQARTDSAGRFTIAGLGNGSYSVRARKVGYASESWDVKLSSSKRVDLSIVLAARPPLLDTIRVSADRDCRGETIESFLCRRSRSNGLFLDYTDIDDKDVEYTAELFRDIPGFRVDFRIERTGPVYRLQTSRPNGCINTLVNGRPGSAANVIPVLASSIVAIEVYTRPESVPPEFQRYTWPASSSLTRTGRCTIVAYWTDNLPHGAISVVHPPLRARLTSLRTILP
jgi:hypothetical protein